MDQHVKDAVLILTSDIKEDIGMLATFAAKCNDTPFTSLLQAQTQLLGKVLAVEHMIKNA